MTRNMPVPISFILVVVTTIALIIFFGAWAVSADAGQLDRTLSFGFAGSIDGGVGAYGASNTQRQSPSLAQDNTGEGHTAADTWWGRSLIVACPLH